MRFRDFISSPQLSSFLRICFGRIQHRCVSELANFFFFFGCFLLWLIFAIQKFAQSYNELKYLPQFARNFEVSWFEKLKLKKFLTIAHSSSWLFLEFSLSQLKLLVRCRLRIRVQSTATRLINKLFFSRIHHEYFGKYNDDIVIEE